MTKPQTEDMGWEETFDLVIWGEAPPETLKYKKGEFIKKFIRQEIAQARQEAVKEMVNYLDSLELNQPEYTEDNRWRWWKYLRNSLRDKYEENNE